MRKLDIRVVVLEAGDAVARKPEELDQQCEQRGIGYRGAESGRSFGLGGTSVLWGGQLIPLRRSDVAARPEVGFESWPIDYEEVAPYFSLVKHQLGLTSSAETEDDSVLQQNFPALSSLSNNFKLRLSEWLPFKMRNFAQAFANDLSSDNDLNVWLNASVVSLERVVLGNTQHIEVVKAQSSNGRQLQVRPQAVVICAGALESTRLLLAFDEESDASITRNGDSLGRYFADHLSVTCGRFICRDWRSYNLAVSPIFSGGVMRTPRLELSGSAQQRMGLPSAFAHFTFVTHGDTGFDVVRNILRKRQGESQKTGLSLSMLGRVVNDVSAMAFWRGIHRRLWIPRQADLLLQVDIEQMPNRNSRLTLSNNRDAFQRKRLAIEWQIKPDDVKVINTVAQCAVDAWQDSQLSKVADLQLTLPDKYDSFDSLYDVYHPTGSLRMGYSAKTSVVNKDLRLWATDNCYISTTAVFPSAGSANPGLTHLALTARLAKHLQDVLAD